MPFVYGGWCVYAITHRRVFAARSALSQVNMPGSVPAGAPGGTVSGYVRRAAFDSVVVVWGSRLMK